jgi:hypothetical protein
VAYLVLSERLGRQQTEPASIGFALTVGRQEDELVDRMLTQASALADIALRLASETGQHYQGTVNQLSIELERQHEPLDEPPERRLLATRCFTIAGEQHPPDPRPQLRPPTTDCRATGTGAGLGPLTADRPQGTPQRRQESCPNGRGEGVRKSLTPCPLSSSETIPDIEQAGDYRDGE